MDLSRFYAHHGLMFYRHHLQSKTQHRLECRMEDGMATFKKVQILTLRYYSVVMLTERR